MSGGVDASPGPTLADWTDGVFGSTIAAAVQRPERRSRDARAGRSSLRLGAQPAVWSALVLLGAASAVRAQPSSPLPLLTQIATVRALPQGDAARAFPVQVRGMVTHFDWAHGVDLLIHDGESGQYIVPPVDPAERAAWQAIRPGDVVVVDGHTARGGFAPNVASDQVRIVGHGTLPTPRVVPYTSLVTGRHDCDYVQIDGVVQRAWLSSDPEEATLFAEVAFEGGVVRALFWEYGPDDIARLTDARVRLRGNIGSIFGSTGQLRGVSIFAGRTADVDIVEPAPDPFTRAARPLDSIYNYSATGEETRRIRVRGVVTGYLRGHAVDVADYTTNKRFRSVQHVFYVQDGTGAARIETEQDARLRPGDLVEAAGFAALSPGRPLLKNAAVRVLGTETEPAPRPVAEPNTLTPENDAELIRIEARVVSVLPGPEDRVLVLQSGDTTFDVHFGAVTGESPLAGLRPHSLVAVTGVYSFQAGPPPSFRLYARSPDDVLLLAPAPWWTLRHWIVMGVTLCLMALAMTAWVRASSRRKRQEYQAVLNERTRVARELHDTLEQELVGITMQLEAVDATLQSSPEAARRSLSVARQMLRYSLEETRRSVMDLRSQALETRDLAGALRILALRMTAGTSVQANVDVRGTPRRMDAAVEHHLLRIGLESITNALKHAAPTRIDLVLRFDPSGVTLTATDDGRGMGTGTPDVASAHLGLQGIRERAIKMGGSLSIASEPGRGTRVAVSVPLTGIPALTPVKGLA